MLRWVLGALLLLSPLAGASPDPYPAPVEIDLEWDARHQAVVVNIHWDKDAAGTVLLTPEGGVVLGETELQVSGRAGDRDVRTIRAEVPGGKFWVVWARYVQTPAPRGGGTLLGWGGPPVLADVREEGLLRQLGDPGLRATLRVANRYESEGPNGRGEGIIVGGNVTAAASWTDTCRPTLLTRTHGAKVEAPKGEVTKAQFWVHLACPYAGIVYGPYALVVDRTGDVDGIEHDSDLTISRANAVPLAALVLALAAAAARRAVGLSQT